MRVLFLGTPDFAVATLEAIYQSDNHLVVGVVTAPDRPAGRGRKLRSSAVAQRAETYGIPILKPEKLRDESFLQAVEALRPDIAVVVAFRMMPKVLWALPPRGTFNIHASLLPDYRGAAPINWAIINGEKKTGVTSFLLDDEIDTGRILQHKETVIEPNETAGEVHDRLMELGARLAVETLDILEDQNLQGVAQEEMTVNRKLKHAPKIFKADTYIDLNQSVDTVHNFIRGLSPYPGAILPCVIDGESVDVKILRTQMTDSDSTESEVIISEGRILLPTKDCALQVLELQVPGKRAMDSGSFLTGWKGPKSWKVRKP